MKWDPKTDPFAIMVEDVPLSIEIREDDILIGPPLERRQYRIELFNQTIRLGKKQFKVPKAVVETSWTEGLHKSLKFDDRMKAEVQAAVVVPINNSPLQPGQVWELVVSNKDEQVFILHILLVALGDSRDGPDKFWRKHTWNCLIVGFSSDPLGIMPQTDGIEELKEELKTKFGEVLRVKFDNEGGFKTC